MTAGVGVLSEFHDTLQDAVSVLDGEGVLGDDNQRMAEMSGQTTEEMLGQTIDGLLDEWRTGDNVDDAFDAYRRVADGESPAERVEFSLQTPAGIVVPVDTRFTRYDEYVVAVLRNLSEIRDREAALQSLSDQLAVLNRFLRHDIRNDMNVVTG
jgi:PAS domain S-box-containing protein